MSLLSAIGKTAAMPSAARNQEQQYIAARYLYRGDQPSSNIAATPMFYQTQELLQHNSMWMPSNAEYKQVVATAGPSSPPSATTSPFVFNNLHQQYGMSTAAEPLTQTWSGAPIVVDYVDHDYIDDDEQPVQRQQQQQQHLHSNRALQNFYDASVQRDHKMLPQRESRNYLPLLPPPFLMHPPPLSTNNPKTTAPTYVRPLKPLDVQQREAERYAAYASFFERYVRMYPRRLMPKYDIS